MTFHPACTPYREGKVVRRAEKCVPQLVCQVPATVGKGNNDVNFYQVGEENKI